MQHHHEVDGSTEPPHPWLGIPFHDYEQHMADGKVGQLQRLHEVTAQQLADHPSRTLGVLGVAGGNGLDLIDPHDVDAVYGYDINPAYLAVCEERYQPVFGNRLHLVEGVIDRSVSLQPVGLLIANLIVEYVGMDEFVAFVAANTDRIGTLSCVVQRNEQTSFVSSTEWADAFNGLAAASSDIDAEDLTASLAETGFSPVFEADYSLPNGKTLIRRDYQKA